MQNLRDKLLKAGLVSTEQAEKAAQDAPPARPPRERERPDRDARPAARSGRPDAPHGGGPARGSDRGGPPRGRPSPGGGPLLTARFQPLTAVPKLPPLPGSKASQRLEAKKQVERDRQLRDRVLAAQVPLEPGERTFYFVTRKNRLRRLELSDAQAEALEQGRLAVVERPDPAQIEHALVPADVAAALLPDHPKAVRFLNRQDARVGFLSDDEVRARAQAEAAETPEQRAAADAPESAEQRAEAAADAVDAGGAGAEGGGAASGEATAHDAASASAEAPAGAGDAPGGADPETA